MGMQALKTPLLQQHQPLLFSVAVLTSTTECRHDTVGVVQKTKYKYTGKDHMDTKNKLPLEMIYHWETAKAEDIYMTQPTGGGQVVDYTWRRAVGEARRMASYLKSLNLPAPCVIR